VGMLLDKGADVNASGRPYGSALQAAAAKGEEKIMGMLLDKGADVNTPGGLYGSGSTPDAALDESSCGTNDPHSDGAVKRSVNPDRKLGNLVFIVTTIFAALFIVRLPFRKRLKFWL